MNVRALAAGCATAIGGSAAVLAYDPFASHALRCPSQLLGIDCPACGGTRAAWLLLHGDLAGAARYNVLLFPFLAYVGARWLHEVAPAGSGWLPGWIRRPQQVGRRAMLGLALVLVAFTVARNLSGLQVLAPPT